MSKLRLLSFITCAGLAFALGLAVPMALLQLSTARGDSCTLPTCATTTTTTVTSNPPTTSSPPPPTSAPARHIGPTPPRSRAPAPPPPRPAAVIGLRARPERPGVQLTWKLQSASLAQVLVRRSRAGRCASTRTGGVAIGGSSVRTSQLDTSARQRGRYCYTVLVVSRPGRVSRGATANHVLIPDWTPPAPVIGLTARAMGRTVALRWAVPSGAPVRYLVRRTTGQPCPAGPTDGTLVGTARTPSFTDTRVALGTRYCYAVFPKDGAGNLQRQVISAPIVLVPPPRVASAPAVAAAGATGSGSTARKLALAGLIAAAVFAAAIGGGLRLARPPNPAAASSGSFVAARLRLDGADPRALVIPAVLTAVTLGLVGMAVAEAL